jgi:hypothetical protein
MEYYDADSLSRALGSFEEQYHLSSEAFYEAYLGGSEAITHIPGFHQHVWASFYREVRRLTGEDFVQSVKQTFELA